MEQVKLHKKGDIALITIPFSMIENTGWKDGTLLDVLKINDTLHIKRREESEGLITDTCPAVFLSENDYYKSEKLIRYNVGLSQLINDLPLPARRVFFLCLYYYFENKFESDNSTSIPADKYAAFVGVDRSAAYRQMKDASDFFMRNKNLITTCDYIPNQGLLSIILSPEAINYITAVDASNCHVVELPLKSALSLQGRYSWPLYQLIKISYPLKVFTIGVDELKEKMSYNFNKKLSVFKRDAISIAIDEITEATDIKRITCVNAEKQGRRVSKVRFEIEMR